MEDQKLLDLENDVLPAQELKTVPLITDDGLLCEDVQNDYSNDIDDLILQPEKVIKLEKQPSLEHSYEVIDQEPPKAFNVDEDNTEVAGKSTNKENDIILESDIINSVNIDDLDIIPLKTEYPKEDLLINLEKPLKKSESPLLSQVTDHDKTEKNQENEPPNVVQPNVKIEDIPEVISTVSTKKDSDEDISDIKIGPEELFCRIGLDKWFYPEKLPPKVEALVYWRNPVLSGAVFGITLIVLLSFAYMSLISVVAYLAIFVQSACILLRLYKTALQTVQKTSESHPFQEYLDLDIRLPQEKAEELSKLAVVHINAVLVELRRLLLAEDLVDSAKFFGILWVLTYVGALFNGLTLIIIGFIALFTLPKVYENNKTQIDQNIELVRSKIAELTNKVRAAIPIGKKTPETKKKE